MLATLVSMLSGCATVIEPQKESKLRSGNEAAQSTPELKSANDVQTPESENETSYNEFRAFLDTWGLTGLISEDFTMTEENKEQFIKYFDMFDDVEFNYVILLLQGIINGTITITDDYNDPEHGMYLHGCQFCLYDMNGDGYPEFILKTGIDEAGYWYTVYTVVDGKLTDCGGVSGGHAFLCTDGSGSFVRYEGQMGCYDITLSTLEGTTLTTKNIASGELDYSKDEDYPDLEEYGYGKYNQYLQFSGLPTLLLTPAG